VAALPGFRLSLVGAACGPGRPGLLRCCQGGQEARSGLASGGDDGELVDFVVRANSFKQDDLFLSLGISDELKYDAIFEVDRTSPRTCQVPFQFMSMKRDVLWISGEQFQCMFNSFLQIRPASY